MKISKLTLIESTNLRSKDGGVIWKCKRSCGKTSYHPIHRVKNRSIRSCGCLRKTKNIEKSGLNALYTMYKYNATKRGYCFDLNKKEFRTFIKSNCHYCNAQPRNMTRKGFFIEANGIDRKENNIGYNIKNCVTCCTICNQSKNTNSYSEFLDLINKIYKNIKISQGDK
jgi:hypothetical protein